LPTGFIFQQNGSPGASAHTALNAAQRTELAAGQLSSYHHKRPMASKFTEYKPDGPLRMRYNV